MSIVVLTVLFEDGRDQKILLGHFDVALDRVGDPVNPEVSGPHLTPSPAPPSLSGQPQ